MVADIAVVVAEADPGEGRKPPCSLLDDHAISHLIFVNKMDRATARVRELLAAFQTVSSRPLLLRQVPIREGGSGRFRRSGERKSLALPGESTSALIQMPDDHRERRPRPSAVDGEPCRLR